MSNLPPGCTQADIDRAYGFDDDEGYEDEPCCCEEFETNSEGRRECVQCGERWWPTKEELERERLQQAEYDEWCRKQHRRELWLRVTAPIRWPIYRLLQWLWPRKSCSVLSDDEIPF